jgi:mannose-1-phosphate guanylyltransferase
MKALLLAAGFGTRLRPITDHIPKCLVPIHQKPLLEYWIDLLLPNKVSEVLINTHYLSSLVDDFIETSPWRDKLTLSYEHYLLGTAGTILHHQQWLTKESFMLAHADNLTRFDVDRFIDAHRLRKSNIDITMMTFTTDVPETCGIVELDEDNVVIQFHEKSNIPHGNLANAAVYIIEPCVIDFISKIGKDIVDLSTEVLPHYLGRMQAFHNDDYHRDIGTPQSLRLAELEFMRG